MKIASFIPTAKSTPKDMEGWIRAITAALTGGWTVGDQAAEVASVRWNSDRAGMTLALQSTTKPIAVIGLSAQLVRASATVISGFPVSWLWAPTATSGAIVLVDLAGLTPSTDYDVRLWAMGG